MSSKNRLKLLELKSLPLLYLNRYVRLFPLLALSVLLQASVMPRVFDGPMATEQHISVECCRDYWWSALLHVQNIVNADDLCLDHIWYLSVDTQLYVVAALMLCGVRRVRSVRATWLVLVAVMLAAQAATIAFCFFVEFSADQYWTVYYQSTITRSPPFFIGILVGYGLHVYRDDKLHLPKWSIFLGYSVALLLSSLAFFTNQLSILWTRYRLMARMSMERSCWALGLGWLILACIHGYGGPVNWFLSLPLWQFVSSLSYAMYLLSYTIQSAAAVTGYTTYFDMHSLLWAFSGDLLITLVLSVVASVVVEAPLLTLYRLLLKPRPKKESNLRISA